MSPHPAPVDYGVILWRGRPEPTALFTAWDVFWIPFSLGWTGGLVAGTISAARAAAPAPVYLVLGIMLAMGCYLMVGRFVVKSRINRRTTYVITDSHAIIEQGGSAEARLLEPKLIRMRRQLFGGRVTVDFEAPLHGYRGPLAVIYVAYANTGMDFVIPAATGGWIPFRFYDVADQEGLMTALRRAGIDLRDRANTPSR